MKAYCKPGSFSKHNSTVINRSSPELENEPNEVEFRVTSDEADKPAKAEYIRRLAASPEEQEHKVIFREEFKRNVFVHSIVFIKEEFLENLKNKRGIKYEDLKSWFL